MISYHPESSRIAAALAALIAVLLASAAYAVDGVVEINQAKALAGGVTASDTAGFPVTIDTAGSYRLTSNLALSSASTTGISVTGEHVTIDLNGFEIACNSCASSGVGDGIAGNLSNLAVRNGTIRNVGDNGVWITGTEIEVDQVRVIDNNGGVAGISVGNGSRVTNSTVSGSATKGILTGFRCLVVNNTVTDSGGIGIDSAGSSVIRGNVVYNSTGNGISCTAAGCSIAENHSEDNSGDGIATPGNSVVARNNSNSNGGDGIEAPYSVVVDNNAEGNTGFGLVGNINTGYGRNVLSFNNSNGAQVSGAAIETDSNVCQGDLICP